MKTTHHLLLSVLTAVAVMTSCEKYSLMPPVQDGILNATLDCSAAATRAILVDNPGVRMETRWQDADSIGVYGTGVSNLKFCVASQDILNNGRTAAFRTTGSIPQGDLLAYSPYSPCATVSDSDITLTFPDTQHYTLHDGVPAPDASCSIMMGTGTAGSGVLFRNAMAMLKIGQVFNTDTTVLKVVFRGLDGEPVSGRSVLSWNGGAPLLAVTGSGSDITLDCGEGIRLSADQLGIFYLIVPARHYARGFEITFVCQGGSVVRTVGTAGGKTLDRSILHMIGDVSAREPLPGTESTLAPNAILMTAANLEKIQIQSTHNDYVYDSAGRKTEGPDGHYIRMPRYSMLVHKDLAPQKGGWIIFPDPTDDLPSGGVYTIHSCEKHNDCNWYEVQAWPEANPAAPFASLTAGTADSPLDLDISSYITSIVDGQGNSVPFQVSARGQILLDSGTVADMLGAVTRAGYHSHRFTSPRLSFNRKDGKAEFNVGGSVSLNTKVALGYMQGECQYAVLKVEPEMEVSLGAALKFGGDIRESCRLYTINVMGIQVAPGVIVVPRIELHAQAGVGGSIQVSGTVSLTQKLGSYSIAYNKGDGVTLRGGMDSAFGTPEVDMEFGGLEGNLEVFGGFSLRTYLSFYGMAGLGLYNDFLLKFGTVWNSDGSLRLALTPEYEATPAVTTLFGSRKFEDSTVKMEMKPLWERYIRPVVKKAGVSVSMNMSDYTDVDIAGLYTITMKIPTGVNSIQYDIELEGNCVSDADVVLLVCSGSGIEYTMMSKEDAAELPAFEADGVRHLFGSTHICNRNLLDPTPIDTIVIGRYEAGTGSQSFKGTAGYDCSRFVSGQAYGVIPALRTGATVRSLNTGSSTNRYNSFMYCWPKRSNGDDYFHRPD
ncbi:MAG: hypothetical protein MJY75_05660 [Bacteroidaceae bacterium]|nr:hypothetical protein [Bacteroidaceae bacterium]